MTAPLVIIAAGGTGGHMFPAQSLAEAMLAAGWRVKLSTDRRGARYAGGFPPEVSREIVGAGTFAGRGMVQKLLVPFRIAGGVASALWAMRRDRPDVVIGFGGYPAFPAMAAAWILRLPRMIHEQYGVLGRVHRVFARRVDRVACSVWPTALPPGTNAIHTGNPVRGSIRAVAGSAYDPGPPTEILVMGGSQGASILSQVVPAAIALLPAEMRGRLRMSHQARDADHDAAVAAYGALDVPADIQPFFDDMPARLQRAALVISRSGASSVADIAVVGRPAIFIPLAIAIRDEQTANAQGLVAAGAAQIIQEPALAPPDLAAHIAAILGDPAKAATMAEAARGQGRVDAVDRLKAEILKLAGHA